MSNDPYGRGYDVWGAPVSRPAPPVPGLIEGLFDAVVVGLFRTLLGWWLELGTTALVAAGLIQARNAGLLWLAATGVALVVTGVLLTPPLRTAVGRLLHRQSVRRCWRRAIRVCALPEFRGGIPDIVKIRRRPAGDQLTVRLPWGGTCVELEQSAELLAASLEVREVRVERHPDNARHATVTIVRRDPLAQPAPAWPHAHVSAGSGTDAETKAGRLSLWDPIPVGVDEDGAPVTISLVERNLLLGGEPGAGKSNALSMLVATAALDPSVQLHLFDGKLVELAAWGGCAAHSVGTSTARAIEVLRELQVEMDDRYLSLLANRARKVTPATGMPLHVVVVDELAHYLLAPDRKERTEFAELLRDLVARGRAAGLIVLAATQKPSHDVIPTALRDLFGFRWALRCSTPQASDTVLGAGWASQDYTASTVDPAHRGVGYLLHEGGIPIRCRAHHVDDDTLGQLAARAETLRRELHSNDHSTPGGAAGEELGDV
jgi:hypothetical protein